MRILCLCSGFLLGCVVQSDDSQEDEVYLVEEEEEAPTPIKDSPKNPPQNEQEEKKDKGFNPCPSDTYVVLEKNGVKYTMVIQVFCDPIQNTLNLGCPEPY